MISRLGLVSSRPLIAILCAALLGGCTSVVQGRGRVGSSAPSSSGSASSLSPPPNSSALPTSTPVVGQNGRTPVSTAIGDPVTADLCTAIGLAALQGAVPDLTPTFDGRQFPPGCSATYYEGADPVLAVSVFARGGDPKATSGRTSRSVSGQVVYVYPFDASGHCAREIKASALVLVVDSVPLNSTMPDKQTSCAGTDAMSNRLAAVVAAGDVPRLPLAPASLTELDACKVVKAAKITSLPAFTKAEVSEQGFGASCEVRRGPLFLFVNLVVADAKRPAGSTPTTVAGHTLYATSVTKDFCSYASTQGTTSDGHYEQLVVAATATDPAKAPVGLCDQTSQAAAKYLDTVGRR